MPHEQQLATLRIHPCCMCGHSSTHSCMARHGDIATASGVQWPQPGSSRQPLAGNLLHPLDATWSRHAAPRTLTQLVLLRTQCTQC
jgi:hypothetical protein